MGKDKSTLYKPTKREIKTLTAHKGRQTRQPLRVGVKLTESDTIGVDHADAETGGAILAESIGTGDNELARLVLGQLHGITQSNGESAIEIMNSALSLVQGVAPEDEVETMLATQMAAVHMATMSQACRLHSATTIELIEAHEKALNRLSRTFAKQIDTLKSYRTKGKQTVVVEHKHYHIHQDAPEGEPGATPKIEGQPHEQLRISESQTVSCNLEADKGSVPQPSNEGLGSVPKSRSKGRSAKGAS